MVTQIDEQHAAMVADAMAPAGQANGLADMALAERAAGMGPVTMHGCLEQMSDGSESGARGRPKRGRFTRARLRRQPSGGTFRHRDPTGPRYARPDDRLREAIHRSASGDMDCFVAYAPRNDNWGSKKASAAPILGP